MKLILAILALALTSCVHPWGKQDPPKQPVRQYAPSPWSWRFHSPVQGACGYHAEACPVNWGDPKIVAAFESAYLTCLPDMDCTHDLFMRRALMVQSVRECDWWRKGDPACVATQYDLNMRWYYYKTASQFAGPPGVPGPSLTRQSEYHYPEKTK